MLSVILSSHNGARTLPRTLASFEQVTPPKAGVEFIAIDNASTDSTYNLLHSHSSRLQMTILHEPRPGKSYAINLGLRSARGDLIVFTDDDVIVDTDWLLAYEKAAATYPDVALFAGQVRHHWETRPPEWLEALAREGRSYAGTPIDLSDGPVSDRYVKGLNFMVRRSVIEQFKFSEAPGINFTGQGSAQGGEETEFVKRALAHGHQLYHVSDARVQHIVRKEQIGVIPVFQRYVRIGRAGVLQSNHVSTYTGPRIFGYPRYLYKTIPRDIFRLAYKWLRGRRYEAGNDVVGLGLMCGRVLEKRRREKM